MNMAAAGADQHAQANPVIATKDGVHAVDARIRVVPAQPRDPFLRRLR
jgi:hypothetical protein